MTGTRSGMTEDRGQEAETEVLAAEVEIVQDWGPWRYPLMALGWACVGLGFLGLVLPLLPGTLFLLIALWAFSQSSARFHAWLYNHTWLGPPLRNWHDHGVITPRAKVASIGMMASGLAVVTFGVAGSWVLPAVIAALLVPVAAFILTRPGRKRHRPDG